MTEPEYSPCCANPDTHLYFDDELKGMDYWLCSQIIACKNCLLKLSRIGFKGDPRLGLPLEPPYMIKE